VLYCHSCLLFCSLHFHFLVEHLSISLIIVLILSFINLFGQNATTFQSPLLTLCFLVFETPLNRRMLLFPKGNPSSTQAKGNMSAYLDVAEADVMEEGWRLQTVVGLSLKNQICSSRDVNRSTHSILSSFSHTFVLINHFRIGISSLFVKIHPWCIVQLKIIHSKTCALVHLKYI
jgi:hypothetical protein